MNTTIPVENGAAPVAPPKAKRKASAAPHRARVAPARAKPGRMATSPKKARQAHTKAKTPEPALARAGSKTAKILDLLRRPDGAALKQLMKATGWQPHSVRGFLSGTIGKKMELTVVSTKAEDGERTYCIEA